VLELHITRAVVGREFELLETKTFGGGHIWVIAKKRRPFELCPKCGEASNTRAGKATTRVRDEPLRSGRLWLEIHKHRYFCKRCKKKFTETVPHVFPRRKTTQRFRKMLAQECADITDLKRVRRREKVSSGLLYQVYYEQIETKLRERTGTLKWPEILGIDEHFFTRKEGFTDYVTVFTDLKKRRLFELAEGKDNKSVIAQIESIPGRERVKLVAIDMSKTYRALIKKLFPNARIVADKFHVLRLLGPAIMKERHLVQGNKHDAKMRRMLLRNRNRLEYDERSELDYFLRSHNTLNELYRAKEKLFEIYRTKGVQRAERSLTKFIGELEIKEPEALKKLSRTLKAWSQEILEYFKTGITNAFTEQTNNRGKLVQKRAYGYKSFRNYRLRLLSACLHEGYAS
jgi:transposase